MNTVQRNWKKHGFVQLEIVFETEKRIVQIRRRTQLYNNFHVSYDVKIIVRHRFRRSKEKSKVLKHDKPWISMRIEVKDFSFNIYV